MNPSTIYSVIYSFMMVLILFLEVALEVKNCFLRLVREADGLCRAPSHFHPKLVNWSPADTNISGVNNPFSSKSSGLTSILD